MDRRDNIWMNSSHNEKCFGQKLWRKSKHAFYVQYILFIKLCHVCANVGNYGRAVQATNDSVIRRMLFARWVTKATHTHTHTHTHSEYVVRFAFPLQQWLHERASLLRYVHCLFC